MVLSKSYKEKQENWKQAVSPVSTVVGEEGRRHGVNAGGGDSQFVKAVPQADAVLPHGKIIVPGEGPSRHMLHNARLETGGRVAKTQHQRGELAEVPGQLPDCRFFLGPHLRIMETGNALSGRAGAGATGCSLLLPGTRVPGDRPGGCRRGG